MVFEEVVHADFPTASWRWQYDSSHQYKCAQSSTAARKRGYYWPRLAARLDTLWNQ